MKNPELGRSRGYDEGWDDLARERLNERLERRSRESLQKNLEQERTNGSWRDIIKKAVEKISEPNKLGAIAAVGFATMMTADVVLNGPSEFVVNSPEAATTALALGAAAMGAAFGGLGRKADMKDTKVKRQAERDARQRRQG